MDWPLVGRNDLLPVIVGAIEGHPGSVVLQGDIGVGKTRLSRAVADTLQERGWHIETCIGSAAATSIPFGALSHLVPEPTPGDVRFNFERMRREVLARAGKKRLLLVVDDANYLDSGSMALVHRLASARHASVLVTHRTGATGNDDTIRSLWKDGFAEHVNVPPLDQESHGQLVAAALGAVRATGLSARLWQLTEGNPLFLRELLSAMEDGDLERWLEGQAPETPLVRLTEIVGSKTRQLPETLRETLEIVALAEPLSFDIASELSDRATLADLQARSLVAVDDLGGVEHIKTAHPIYGATIRAMVPSLRKSTLAATLADTLMERALRRPGDALRAAVWLQEANKPLPVELAVRAANEALARGDAPLAENLASQALEREETAAALVALGTALSVQRKVDAAGDALNRALQAAGDDEERVEAALAYSRHQAWVGRDYAEGTRLLDEMIPTVAGPGAKSKLRAERAFFSAATGDAVGAFRVSQEVLADPGASEAAVLSSLIHSTRARTMLGWFDGLEQEIDRGESLAIELRETLPLALDQISHNHALSLRFVDLVKARRVARSGYERSLREGGPSGLWSGTLSWLLVDSGDLDGAIGLMERSGEEFDRYDPFHNVLMHRSLAALVYAVRGDFDTACRWFDKAGPLAEMEPRSRVWADRAAVWLAAREPDRAARLAVAAGERAEAHTIMTWGAALLYHDAVRMGHPGLAVEPLARLARSTTAPLIPIMTEHARAAAAGDAAGLLDVADDFERRGSPLLAAEALTQAARCSDRADGMPARLLARAVHLASLCPGAQTPLLAAIDSPLSAREEEIARLAANGESSREIAERLFLSVRTVDNHLATVYKKLGLSGRQELSLVFTSREPRALMEVEGIARTGR